MSRLIIKCGICEWQGVKQTLAEVLDNGLISIRRSRQLIPYQHTLIAGNDFALICEKCQQVAYRKMPVLIKEHFEQQIYFGTVSGTL
jgi:hypothetical protein